MWKLRHFLKKYKIQAVLAPLFKLFEVILSLLVPIVVADIIDVGIANSDENYIYMRVVYLVILALLGLIMAITAQYFSAWASSGFASDIREACYEHIQKFSYTDLDKEGASTLITRLTSDVNQIQTGLNLALRLLLRSPFVLIGSLVMAFTINTKCALIFLYSIPVLFIVVISIMTVSIPIFERAQKQLDRLTNLTRENLTGVRVIRAFCREEDFLKEFNDENKALTKINEYVGRFSASINPITYILINLATIWLVYKGAIEVQIGNIQQGDVVALYNYMAQIIIELVKLASLLITMNKSMACADRVLHILSVEPSMKFSNEKNLEIESKNNDIVVAFDNVSFAYQGASANSLSDISFVAKKGQTIGIIGGTGSGKTTLVNLIARFYDPVGGEVLINGKSAKSFKQEELTGKIGIVPQKPVLFRGTIRENLLWGNINATDEEIMKALEISQALEFVEKKENKLDEMVEQLGRNFSGGQRQRLTIARAVVKKPEILMLDDSGSALDYATEAALRKALSSFGNSTTIFIISQRTSSIKQADFILALDDGKLVGKGTHDELMKNCNLYQEIYYSQFPDERPNENETTHEYK